MLARIFFFCYISTCFAALLRSHVGGVGCEIKVTNILSISVVVEIGLIFFCTLFHTPYVCFETALGTQKISLSWILSLVPKSMSPKSHSCPCSIAVSSMDRAFLPLTHNLLPRRVLRQPGSAWPSTATKTWELWRSTTRHRIDWFQAALIVKRDENGASRFALVVWAVCTQCWVAFYICLLLIGQIGQNAETVREPEQWGAGKRLFWWKKTGTTGLLA